MMQQLQISSRRGEPTAVTQWGQFWLHIMNQNLPNTKLSQGRVYARDGSIVSIDFSAGVVSAAIQGRYQQPYNTAMTFALLSPDQIHDITNIFAQDASKMSALLAGICTPEIAQTFQEMLFKGHMGIRCSCYDRGICKHVAALLYLIGEYIDNDPYLLFYLRGIRREDLIQDLLESTAKKPSIELPPIESFWKAKPLGTLTIKPKKADAYKSLGDFPWRAGQRKFRGFIQETYKEAKRRAHMLLSLHGR